MGWKGGAGRSAGGLWESSGWVLPRPEREQRARNEAARAELIGGRISWLWEVSVPLGQAEEPEAQVEAQQAGGCKLGGDGGVS